MAHTRATQSDCNSDGNGRTTAMAGRRMGRAAARAGRRHSKATAQQDDGVAGQGRATQIDSGRRRAEQVDAARRRPQDGGS